MSPRPVAALLVAVLSLGACSDGAAPLAAPSVDEVSLRLERLHRQMDEIAQTQALATGRLGDVLRAVRELDRFVAGMRDQERISATEETWPRVDAAFAAADVDGLRQPLLDVAVQVDSARVTLRQARGALEEDWERGYLDAEDRVLVAVRGYAEATDALVQVLQQHWATYTALHDASAAYVGANEFYRSREEAVQAYEVRISRAIGALAAAQDEIGRFREQQERAASAVNEAAADADAAWQVRPTPTTAPHPTP